MLYLKKHKRQLCGVIGVICTKGEVFMGKRATKIAALLCVAMLSLTGCGDKTSDVADTEMATTEVAMTETENASEISLSYEFTGNDADKAVYAE